MAEFVVELKTADDREKRERKQKNAKDWAIAAFLFIDVQILHRR